MFPLCHLCLNFSLFTSYYRKSATPSHLSCSLPLPEVSAVVGIWIAVLGHHHPVGELPPR